MQSPSRQSLLEGMIQINSYFEGHAKREPLFMPEFIASTKINALLSENQDLKKEDVEQIQRILRETEESEHVHGTGWLEYKMKLSYLLSLSGFKGKVL